MSEELTPQQQTTGVEQPAAQAETQPAEASVNPDEQQQVEVEEEEEKKERPVLKALLWILICLVVVFLGTVVSSYLAGFDCVTDMYAWIWGQIQG